MAAQTSFFPNSLRRPPLKGETAINAIAKLDMGCTGFYLSNSADKVLLMSARHCTKYQPKEWCKAGGKATDQADGTTRTCKDTVFFDGKSDIVIYEFSGAKINSNDTFALSNFHPKIDTRVMTYGYPVDSFAQKGLNIVENCWIVDFAPKNTVDSRKHYLSDSHFSHNCTTFGGNSGGPMVIEGTYIVVGIPALYIELTNKTSKLSLEQLQTDPFQKESLGEASFMFTFVSQNEAELRRLKIKLVKESDISFNPPWSMAVLFPGVYQNQASYPGYEVRVHTFYNSGIKLAKIHLEWIKSIDQTVYSNAFYNCATEFNCTNLPSGTKINLIPAERKNFNIEPPGQLGQMPSRIKLTLK